jgi:hypothetical protein
MLPQTPRSSGNNCRKQVCGSRICSMPLWASNTTSRAARLRATWRRLRLTYLAQALGEEVMNAEDAHPGKRASESGFDAVCGLERLHCVRVVTRPFLDLERDTQIQRLKQAEHQV